jgi:hypothetical protein
LDFLDRHWLEWVEGSAPSTGHPANPAVCYTHGKNATDSAMIIDAMDLL